MEATEIKYVPRHANCEHIVRFQHKFYCYKFCFFEFLNYEVVTTGVQYPNENKFTLSKLDCIMELEMENYSAIKVSLINNYSAILF